MEFAEAMNIRTRMCDFFGGFCESCPAGYDNNGKNMYCPAFITQFPEKAEEILEKWNVEHPAKTRKQVLLEHFPNAELTSGGTPTFCAKYLGIANSCEGICAKCWNQPHEDKT